MVYKVLLILGIIIHPMNLMADTNNVLKTNNELKTNEVLFFQKQYLNDPIMKPELDTLQSSLDQHVYQIREGSIGGFDSVGGNCGCN